MAAVAGSGTEERLELELEPAEGAETPLVWKQRGEELPLGCSGFPWGFFLGLGLSAKGPCPDGSLSRWVPVLPGFLLPPVLQTALLGQQRHG